MDFEKYIIKYAAGNLYWKDLNGRYLGCNQQFALVAGVDKPENIVGKSDKELFAKFLSEEEINQLIFNDREVMNKGIEDITEEIGINEKGETAYYITRKIPLRNEKGIVIGLIGTSIDITNRVEAEKKLAVEKIKSEAASRAKSEFIANMSHDLRTPITGMLGMVQDMLNTADQAKAFLQQQAHSSLLLNLIETVQRDSQFLMGATDELLQLCNEILEVVCLESGKAVECLESFNLYELIEHNIELLQPVARHKKLHLSHEIDQTVPKYLKGCRLYLDRVLLNLISNALKFTKEGFVKVTVSVLKENSTSQRVGEPITLQIFVEDSGIGIPKEKFDTIFEHFSRLTPAYEGLYKGAGLGLYTVKRYVEAMNAEIKVDSEVGKGTCFTTTVSFLISDHADRVKVSIRAPKPPEPFIAKPVVVSEMEDATTKETTMASILIVEDSTLAAIAVQLALKPFHCATDVAENGEQAVTMATSGHYDLILMDIGLPDFSGVEATQKIRALSDTQKSQVPIVALTGHANDPEKRQEALEAGMQDVLSKPAQPLALESILRQYVFKAGAKEKPLPALTESTLAGGIESLAVIDWDGCVHMCNGNPDFARELLSMLVEDLKVSKATLEKAYTARNIPALRAELHRTRGGVCYLKLPQLENALKIFDEAVKAEPQNKPGSEKLEKLYAELQQAINNFLKTWDAGNF